MTEISIFDIYNPYYNTEVTTFYLSTIKKSLAELNYLTEIKSKIVFSRRNKSKGIIVVTPLDVEKARRAKYGFVICWAQGICPEESFMKNKSRMKYLILSYLEKKGLMHADYLFLVTNEMRMFYETKYKIALNNSFIMPCFSDELTFGGFSSEKDHCFVYAGGMDEWQCFPETVQLYSKIEKKVPGCKLLVLVKDNEKAKAVINKYQVINYEIGYYSKEMLSSALRKVKFGFCLRRNDPVNYVSTPTKLSSYICNGIIPIVSSSVKDFAQHAVNSKYSIIVDDEDEAIRKIKDLLTNDISNNDLFADLYIAYGDYYSQSRYVEEIKVSLKKYIKCNE